MFSKIIVAVLLISTLFVACNNDKGLKVIEREEEPDIYQVGEDDKAMNEAIVTANKTLHLFNAALKSAADSLEAFSLKVRYDAPDGYGEHIWLNEVTLRNNIYTGIVNNVPNVITQVSLGDTVTVNNNNISDWMYLSNNKMRGGHTLRVIMKKMSPEERKNMQAQMGFIVE